jgi:cytoskeleton protein RodZ
MEAALQKEPEPARKAEAVKKTPEAPKPAPAFVNAAQGSTLKFVFKGQSWVEVRDSKGKLLFSRLNSPGSDAEVSGKPPFNVVVGNAPEVQLYYNDHEFDLEPHTKVAVARFTVE